MLSFVNKIQKGITNFRENRKAEQKWKSAMEISQRDDYDAACRLWKEFTEENPNVYEAFYNWGIVLVKYGKFDVSNARKYYHEACEKFQKAAEINPDDSRAFDNWGCSLSDLAEFSEHQAEELYHQACEKYQKASKLKPDNHRTFYNWGTTLLDLADLNEQKDEKLYREASIKCQKATELKPDYYQAFDSWGAALAQCGRFARPEESEKLFQQVEKILLKAEEIKKGAAAYNLACLFAQRNNEEKCKYWLKICEDMKDLPTRVYAMKDYSLANMQDKDWFKAIRWKGE